MGRGDYRLLSLLSSLSFCLVIISLSRGNETRPPNLLPSLAVEISETPVFNMSLGMQVISHLLQHDIHLNMSVPFHPRMRFLFPTRTPSWFAGHMARSLNELPNLLKDIDLVIEARDARLPLTSVNSAFDNVLRTSWGLQTGAGMVDVKGKQREKLVVYTKRDLAESRFEQVSLPAVQILSLRLYGCLAPLQAAETSIRNARRSESRLCRYTFRQGRPRDSQARSG